ncbi:MAG: ATP-binding protein [Betaproteobacteria bacterium]
MAAVAAWVLPAYAAAVAVAAVVDAARSDATAAGWMAWIGWGLVGLPLLALTTLAHRRRDLERYPHWLLTGLAVVGIGWVVLRASATAPDALATHGGSLEALLVLLLAAAQPALLPGLLVALLLWGLQAWVLWAGRETLAVYAAEQLGVLQAVAIGVAMSVLLGRLARAEFAARRTLIAHRDRFERIKQSRTRFIAAASHDLRQPLHAVAFLSQALRARLKDPPAETVLRRLEQAAQTTDHMIRDLLELTKLDAGAVELRMQPVPLRIVFENVHSEFAEQARAKGLTLHVYKTDLACRSDPVALQRIVSNFVSNAIRYTDVGLVYLRAVPADGMVRIRVRDTGIGIATRDREHLFEEFHQVRKDRGGTGLGLAITKRLCDALDHRLEVESEPGSGSAFTVVVPQLVRAVESVVREPAPNAARAKAQAPLTAQPLAGSMVVLVDDDSARRDAMRPVIESWGATVVDAGSGAEAEEKLSGILTTPDLMIVDDAMGAGETSEQVITRLQDAYGADIPSLVVGDGGVQLRAPANSAVPRQIKPDELERALLAARSTVPRPPPPAS